MPDDELIKWYFTEDIYKILRPKIERANYFLMPSVSEYGLALTEMRQIYTLLSGELNNNKETKELAETMATDFEQAVSAVRLFEQAKMADMAIPSVMRLRRQSKMRAELEDRLYKLYASISQLMSRLGMFAPHEKKDNRLAIYKQ